MPTIAYMLHGQLEVHIYWAACCAAVVSKVFKFPWIVANGPETLAAVELEHIVSTIFVADAEEEVSIVEIAYIQ